VAVVLDNVLAVMGDEAHFDPQKGFTCDREPVEMMTRVASEAVRLLHERE